MTTLTVNPNGTFALSEDERLAFRDNGYLGPFTLCSPEEMAEIRVELDRILGEGAKVISEQSPAHNRHLDCRLVHDLASHPAIVQRMASIVGPDLFLWRTHFWVKEPGGAEIPWHQDYNYWPLEPAVILSAWIAIDEARLDNSAVQIIPGSHRTILPHVPSPQGMAFGEMADPSRVDTSKAVDMVLKPGEFFLFNERTLHHSFKNTSTDRRLGLASRVIPGIVNVLRYDGDRHRLVKISGEDRLGFNQLCDPPSA